MNKCFFLFPLRNLHKWVQRLKAELSYYDECNAGITIIYNSSYCTVYIPLHFPTFPANSILFKFSQSCHFSFSAPWTVYTSEDRFFLFLGIHSQSTNLITLPSCFIVPLPFMYFLCYNRYFSLHHCPLLEKSQKAFILLAAGSCVHLLIYALNKFFMCKKEQSNLVTINFSVYYIKAKNKYRCNKRKM